MSSSSDDSNHHPWKRAAWRASDGLADALIALQNNYPPFRSLGVSEAHEAAEKMLFEYLRAFEPKKRKLGSEDDDLDETESDEMPLWWQPIGAVYAPTSGVVRLNDARFLREQVSDTEILHRIDNDIPMQKMVLKLGSLREQWQTQSTIQIQLKGWVEQRGYINRTISEQRHLPISSIIQVRRHLDECMEELGWLPEVESTPRVEITEELVEEVEQWRKRKLEA